MSLGLFPFRRGVTGIHPADEEGGKLGRLEQVYRVAPVGLCLIDRDFRYLWINEALAAVHGVPAELHTDRTVAEIAPGLACEAVETVRRVLDTGEPLLAREVRGAPSAEEGTEKHWRLSCHPVIAADGTVEAVSLILEDITKYKQTTQALEERLQFERLLADLSAGFLDVPSGQVDEVIDGSLKALVESLGIDRSTLAEFSEDKRRLFVTHSYTVPGIKPFPVGVFVEEKLPWYVEQLRSGKTLFYRRLPEDLPREAVKEKQHCIADGLKSNVTIPLAAGGSVLGVITFAFLRRHCDWDREIVLRLQILGEIFAGALLRKRSEDALRAALAENQRLNDRLERENVYLREQAVLKHGQGRIIGRSEGIRRVLAEAESVAATDAAVLLLGETGTGKELVAQRIHDLSARKDRPLVIVNCASLPPTLIESELFGREAGAYTGAASAQVGRFDLADGSTLFLDEIGELPPELQGKLLRVLQDGRFERLGSPETIAVNVRIVAATNRDLEQAVREGKFRSDLYYRLNVFPIRVPPLRERREDIPLLVWAFVEEFGRRMGKSIQCIPRRSLKQLQQYAWPGNVRELSNVIERAMILASGPTLHIEVPTTTPGAAAPQATLEDSQREHILRVLQETGWRIRGANGAAEILGVKPTTLESRMARLRIRRDKRDSDIS